MDREFEIELVMPILDLHTCVDGYVCFSFEEEGGGRGEGGGGRGEGRREGGGHFIEKNVCLQGNVLVGHRHL